eukprot:gnl/MRDRNA2_/MRDRNA2_132703_c0_seq1.p1 gnl/MRDRNA2_/MRDRNA2_132703_c0~~gnl/MRDRNA2_/MRDRNA2_132703_c0_seq1.p1  ORF type:complete len:395 (+),score=38.87 gnl/MRDRNA2_/MRDRNA2_132703_c0_seq1:119-1186(+)
MPLKGSVALRLNTEQSIDDIQQNPMIDDLQKLMKGKKLADDDIVKIKRTIQILSDEDLSDTSNNDDNEDSIENAWQVESVIRKHLNASFELKQHWRHCGAIRSNYVCTGPKYEKWLSDHAIEQDAIASSVMSSPTKKNILFIGNSHIRELAETLLCLQSDHITDFHAIHGNCLKKHDYKMECNGHNGCNTDLAKASFGDGSMVYIAVNHPWLFRGAKGMAKALDHLAIDLSTIDTIVLGAWNQWDQGVFKDGDYYRRACGEATGDRFLGPWTTEDFLSYVESQRFRGRVQLAGMFGKFTLSIPNKSFPFEVRQLHALKNIDDKLCGISGCGPTPGHQCIPGTTSYVVDEIVKLNQ